MTNSNKLQKIKDSAFDLIIHCISDYNDERLRNVFNEEIGKMFFEDLIHVPEIEKFQWEADVGGKFNFLPSYLNYFLSDLSIFAGQNNLVLKTKSELSKNDMFKDYFNSRYRLLESEVLIDDSFRYKILIPAFGILLDKIEKIELDSNHTIRNIKDVKHPYGEHHSISDFKKQPLFWTERRAQQKWEREATASIEISYNLKKRLKDEDPYPFTLMNPGYAETNENFFDEIIYSIYDFFMLYSDRAEFVPFSISHYYWVKLPSFMDLYPFLKAYLYQSFPPANAYLRMYEETKRNFWMETWNTHYEWFFAAYHGQDRNLESKRIFRYAIDILRSLTNVKYADLRVFILVSTLEGLLYKKSIGSELGYTKFNKQGPVIALFKKICEDQEKKWIQFQGESQDEDLTYFLKDAFTLRNNIAHPGEIKSPKYLPSNLYEALPERYHLGKLKEHIQVYLKEFLWFLLKICIDKKIESKDQWFVYLETLKSQILTEKER